MKQYFLTLLFFACSTIAVYAQEIPIQDTIGFQCGFQGPANDEEREKLPYFGNNEYLMNVLREKVGIDIEENYQKRWKKKVMSLSISMNLPE